MSDVIEGSVTPQVSNATVNAGGKLLKAVELQLKYGTPTASGRKTILLSDASGEEPSAAVKEIEDKFAILEAGLEDQKKAALAAIV